MLKKIYKNATSENISSYCGSYLLMKFDDEKRERNFSMARTINDSDDTISDLWDTNTTDSERQNPVLILYATYILVLICKALDMLPSLPKLLTTIKGQINVHTNLETNK